jgi:hypothetical protein
VPSPLLFSGGAHGIVAFPLTADGNVAPAVTTGSGYALFGFAFDGAANLYVEGFLHGPITVYAPSYQGPPIRTIQQPGFGGHGHTARSIPRILTSACTSLHRVPTAW